MNKFGIVAIAGLLLLVLSACGGQAGGSVQAYCDTVAKHRDRYLSAMDEASSSDALTGLLSAAGAIGDLNTMWTDLAKVAPDEIRTDTEAVKKAWEKSEEAAASGNVFGALTSAISNTGATDRVNTYIAENCRPEFAPAGYGAISNQEAVA